VSSNKFLNLIVVYNHLSSIIHNYQVNEIRNRITLIIEHFDKAILEYKQNLNILIDGILFEKQGLIHPRIILPSFLIKSSSFMNKFPVAIKGIDKLLKISDLRIAYTQKRLVYILHIPLLTTKN